LAHSAASRTKILNHLKLATLTTNELADRAYDREDRHTAMGRALGENRA